METAQLQIGKTELTLLSGKALLLNDLKMLVISDLHLGKAGHFRKYGIPISKNIHHSDLSLLGKLISKYFIKQLLIIGDLFHSDLNNEWDLFVDFIEKHPRVNAILVAGNHDKYTKATLKEVLPVYEERYCVKNIIFTHEPLASEAIGKDEYNICGHIHPAVKLNGNGRQSMKLPCFYFGEKQGIIPAFGKFTGSALIKPQQHDRVFVVTENHVLPVT